MAENRYNDLFEEAEGSLEYWAEQTILDFTEELVRLMDEQGVSRADLARSIDSSQAYVTKVLSGHANFTVATMTKLARALDAVVRVHLAPDDVAVRWEEEPLTQDMVTNVVFGELLELDLEPRMSDAETETSSSFAA